MKNLIYLKKERNWKIVNYQLKTKGENITVRSLFGVSYINNNIILIGDKENNKIINPNYLLKPNEKDIDIIVEYGYIESNILDYFQKNFLFLSIIKNLLLYHLELES